ncbi:hypothetical protein ONE63_009228 [Megalurothrips usitatus]|uniref:Lipocalin/cytosolic fatty-acid binding domain-containing protein n=1 Tax=Megalurothrips usitatus TaxID=439358 RepID=A0AAV7XN35_9NEOP|nr:hypothetical protein ONE63_009228 [Megalurothrips usitatus]
MPSSRPPPALPGLVVAVLVTAAASAARAVYSCPDLETQRDFNATKYFGKWVEMLRSTGMSENKLLQCGTIAYAWEDPNRTVTFEITNYQPDTDLTWTDRVSATVQDLDAGKFTVQNWPVGPGEPDRPVSSYWVLATDYTNYSLVYSCITPAEGIPMVGVWVLARSREAYGDAAKAAVTNALQRNAVTREMVFEDVRQTSCPPDSCAPCPSSVTAGLDVDKLAGRWWEVQHSLYSGGGLKQGCSRTIFSKIADGVQIDLYTVEYTSETGKSVGVNKSLSAKWTDAGTKSGDFVITKGFVGGDRYSDRGAWRPRLSQDSRDRLCILGTDYDTWAAMSICVKNGWIAHNATNGGGDSSRRPTTSGVWVLSRRHGLTTEQQMLANKAVVTAGIPAADMVMSPSTPCSAAALEDAGGSGAAAAAPLILLVSSLAAGAKLF